MSQFTCLVYTVTCMHPLQVVVLCVFTVQSYIEESSAVSLFQVQDVQKQAKKQR